MVSPRRRRGQVPCRSLTPSADPSHPGEAQEAGGRRWSPALGAAERRPTVATCLPFCGKAEAVSARCLPIGVSRQSASSQRRGEKAACTRLGPFQERKQRAQAKANAPTFCALADEYLAKLKREARADATVNKTEWLLAFAKAEFGDEPIADVSAPMVLRVLQRLEARERYEFARRLRSTVGSAARCRSNRLNPLLLPTTGEACAVRNPGRILTLRKRGGRRGPRRKGSCGRPASTVAAAQDQRRTGSDRRPRQFKRLSCSVLPMHLSLVGSRRLLSPTLTSPHPTSSGFSRRIARSRTRAGSGTRSTDV